ncbi:unnamed protein product, partial [Trichogramma brassicae]
MSSRVSPVYGLPSIRRGVRVRGLVLRHNMALDAEYASHILKNVKKLISRKLFVEEALALLVDANLTKASYNVIRNAALKTSHEMYPTYDEV